VPAGTVQLERWKSLRVYARDLPAGPALEPAPAPASLAPPPPTRAR
jgi:hypothetical protein